MSQAQITITVDDETGKATFLMESDVDSEAEELAANMMQLLHDDPDFHVLYDDVTEPSDLINRSTH